MAKKSTPKIVETLRHADDKRKNIPTAEYQSMVQGADGDVKQMRYPRNTDLDPQLVWRGKDEQDWSDLVVNVPPLYIQEKVHPKVLIDDLLRQTKQAQSGESGFQTDLFGDFNGIPEGADKTEFYSHDQNWTNRMILGDSLQVMASLAEREGLRGKVQCIYFDPPYGIKFNSNFQWSTTSRDVKDGKADHITREPEQVKAFRDTWRDGIHSYLTYLRDRLTVARDLLTDSGSIFVQISDENVHRVRAALDEVFGDENFCGMIAFQKSGGSTGTKIETVTDYLLWFAKNHDSVKIRSLLTPKEDSQNFDRDYCFVEDAYGGAPRKLSTDEKVTPESGRRFRLAPCNSQHFSKTRTVKFAFRGREYLPGADRQWSVDPERLSVIGKATNRLTGVGNSLMYKLYVEEAPGDALRNVWMDTAMAGLTAEKIFVVQTSPKAIQRCLLMTTDPGDLVLDPTCGSGTTATVAEQWGRRWITIDTSRVALALARARIMGARYPFYLLADSKEGQQKEAEVTRTAASMQPVYGNIRHGFVYERVPHITLKSIANNDEIDVIWDKWQLILEPLREKLNTLMKTSWEDWQIPRFAEHPWTDAAQKLFATIRKEQSKDDDANEKIVREALESLNALLGKNFTLEALPERPADPWPAAPTEVHAQWWEARIARQKEIDASIAAKAEFEYLYDKPYEDKKRVRVAGPFTVESLTPHRSLDVDEDDNIIDRAKEPDGEYAARQTFPQMILENLKTAGVQQAHKDDRITFTSIVPWPGDLVCGEGRYMEGDVERRAAILIGPEFGTVLRSDLVAAAREAADARFDVLIACAFNYEAHTTEFNKLGSVPVLKARMNADLHMAEDLKNTGKGNLFVIFGEPDIELLNEADGKIRVKINGVDVFKPQTGEVVSDGADGIACWFIDTDYNEESFFVRHAYFLGANDPYSSLKTTLKAEIDESAWSTLNSDTSRPFDKPSSGRIAVKVINHLGDEVMKVYRV